jgi:hypothetical protein
LGEHMTENWRTEWSRHFDQIQWTATTILTAGLGGLLVYSHSEFNPWLAFIGLWLTLLTVYYAASFREFRRELHEGLADSDERTFLLNTRRKRYLRQWPAFLLTFQLLTCAWLYQFWVYGWRWRLCMLILISMAIFLTAIRRGHIVMKPKRSHQTKC